MLFGFDKLAAAQYAINCGSSILLISYQKDSYREARLPSYTTNFMNQQFLSFQDIYMM